MEELGYDGPRLAIVRPLVRLRLAMSVTSGRSRRRLAGLRKGGEWPLVPSLLPCWDLNHLLLN